MNYKIIQLNDNIVPVRVYCNKWFLKGLTVYWLIWYVKLAADGIKI